MSESPLRTLLKRVTMPVFKLGLVVFLVLGVVLVLGQAAGLVVGDGTLVEGVAGALALPMTTAAAVTGLLGFLLSYLHRWSAGED
ncbi:hypothetical protein [Amycolatopsis magusensis]|uniref:Uncharacterized protein n=1 Tax=Amycolatopsis magusensis TaxID=882444 RepID=A0ABS4PQE6_9PSEU|nr:hypothetical protein [Amycolatopsis magusensis]MBP2181653.1 hypothetical protein [Amycolatopsis magusensis]MDI5975799.1 hypothetical protein [Amycolatopsis magusensis]